MATSLLFLQHLLESRLSVGALGNRGNSLFTGTNRELWVKEAEKWGWGEDRGENEM